MDGLQFEDSSLNNEALEEKHNSCENKEQEAIAFSNSIVDLLTDLSEEECTLKELKSVYIEAGENPPEDYKNDVNLWALAKVNMFIRMKSLKEIKVSAKESSPQRVKEITGLELEIENVSDLPLEEIDATKGWLPSEEDFQLADSFIKKYDLKFSFSSVSDLYIEEYKPLELDWE